jgi:SPP1 gp7 family putative phage head morphogenesis protein
MVTATTEFYQAILNLQEEMRDLDLQRSARIYYRNQKRQTLSVLSRFPFLFSESYQRMGGSIPDLWDLEVMEQIRAGSTYQETYRGICRIFDRRIREVSIDLPQSDRLISAYEKKLIQVYNEFGAGSLDIIREHYRTPSDTTIKIGNLQEKLMKSARRMLKKQVPKFWEQGVTWAEICLQDAKKKEEYKKPDINIPANQDAIDALIERNLGFIKGMTDDQRKGMLAELTEGMIKGEGIDQLVKRLAPYVEAGSGKGQTRAELIARTEVMYGLNAGTISRYKKDGIEKVQWLAGPDDRMCPVCGEKNGSVYAIGSEPSLPFHPDCRCCWVPYFETGKTIDDRIKQDLDASIYNTEFDKTLKRLGYSDAEIKVIKEYKSDGYDLINNDARKHNETERVKLMDDILKKSKIDRDVVVYHGSGRSEAKAYISVNPGDTINIDSFYSTSLKESKADNNFNEGKTLLKITVKSGSNGFYFGDPNFESEVLLPRGSNIKVTDISSGNHGKIISGVLVQ